MDLLPSVADFIRRHQLLRPKERVVAAVSGGADSLCLLDCLARLGYAVVVAHLDHRLRPESRDDAEYTLTIARHYELPAVMAREDVRALARRGVSLEQAARLVRYRFLVRAAREHRARAIATGHTADDQAETVLMHFLRGAGPEGLRGMLPSTSLDDWSDLPGARGLRLIRPLLAVTRDETATHCAERGLTPRHDSSNLDLAFLRNRLRHNLLPALEEYNPEIRTALCRTGRLMSTVAELLDRLVDGAWNAVVLEAGQGALAFRVAAFREQPEALQLALIRKVASRLNQQAREFPLAAVDRARQWILSPPRGGRTSLGGGLELWHVGQQVVIASPGAVILLPEFPQLRSLRPRRLPLPGTTMLASGWKLEASIAAPGERQPLSDRRCVAFDADELEAGLTLRSPRPGDRLEPMGMSGSTKLSDVFVNLHVPRITRERWPVVAAGDRLLWVVGLRRSCHAPVGRRTRRRLMLRLVTPGKTGRA